MNSQSIARGLAFFSLGLGAAELLAPRQLARAIGVDEGHENLLRALGLREIGAGVGLMQGNPATFLWSRVAGDVMDIALLGAALRSERTQRNRTLTALAAVIGVTAVDVWAATRFSRNPAEPGWRVQKLDRSGLEPDDPVTLRDYTERTVREHQSGHLRASRPEAESPRTSDYATAASQMQARESAAVQQFEPGD